MPAPKVSSLEQTFGATEINSPWVKYKFLQFRTGLLNFVKLADTVFIHLVSWHLLDDLCCHALVVNVNPCQISSVKEKQLDKETKPFLASDQYLFLSFGFGVR